MGISGRGQELNFQIRLRKLTKSRSWPLQTIHNAMRPVATWTLDILQILETTTATTVGIDEKIRDSTIEIVNHGKDLVRDQDMEVAIGEMAAKISDQKQIA